MTTLYVGQPRVRLLNSTSGSRVWPCRWGVGMGRFCLVEATPSSVNSEEVQLWQNFPVMRSNGCPNFGFCKWVEFIRGGPVTIWTTWTSFKFDGWFGTRPKRHFFLVFTNLRCFLSGRKYLFYDLGVPEAWCCTRINWHNSSVNNTWSIE